MALTVGLTTFRGLGHPIVAVMMDREPDCGAIALATMVEEILEYLHELHPRLDVLLHQFEEPIQMLGVGSNERTAQRSSPWVSDPTFDAIPDFSYYSASDSPTSDFWSLHSSSRLFSSE